MVADKSLAAEIEAAIRRFAYVGPDGQIMGLPEAAKVLAALQGRALEDRARWMRERAAQTADYARERAAIALHGSCDGSDTNRTRRDLARSLKGQIAALPLQPEGERNA